MPTLFYTNASCSQSAFIAAKIAGVKVDFDSVHFDWTTGDHKTGSGKSFKSINPKGNVPALLLDDGTVLSEGPAVHLWLAQQAPAAGLFPADRSSTAFLKSIEYFNYVGTDVHAGSIALLFSPLASQAAEINKKLSGKFDFLAANWLKGKHTFSEDSSKPSSADLYLWWAIGCALWKEVPVNDHIKAVYAHISALPAVAAAKAESDVAFAPKA